MIDHAELSATAKTLDEARSDLAFFVPTEQTAAPGARTILAKSRFFLVENGPLLPGLYGQLVQFEDYQGDRPMSRGLTVDFRAGNAVTWQITAAEIDNASDLNNSTGARREVRQFTAGPGGTLEGWSAEYDIGGRLIKVTDLDEPELVRLWETVQAILELNVTKKANQKAWGLKERQEEALALFALTRTVRYLVPADITIKPELAVDEFTDKKTGGRMLLMDSKLGKEAAKKELEERVKLVHRLGFTMLEPAKKPNPTPRPRQLYFFWQAGI